jgi:TonB family protein
MSQAQAAQLYRYRGATQAQRLGGFGASVFLHAALALLIIFLARTPVKRFNLDTPMLNLTQLTIGASEPKPAVQPGVGKEAAPPVPKPAEPEAVPVPRIEELPKEPEAPPQEPAAPDVPKEEPKEPPKPSDEDLLAAALSGAKDEAKPAPKISGGQSLVDDALKSAGSAAKTEKVITGESGSGVGVLALYEEVVATEIRRHFTTRPYADGRVFEVKVLVEIAANGTLVKATVLEPPSGDPTLDANVMRAIREVGRFEPPPGKRAQKLELVFSSDIYAGQ